ncbi:G-protein-signaling modulator 1-like isoform X2 [Paramormyrops kingsleyae]|uniref:G protein signaling modulator 1b n=1 Tax=Paramormyrops kingsleyae TaxID=1676925 RepID=A0A3B3S2P3_9TELE|nr:G-protein-signaling modulator 1-like isoform X2 [Paramormyrops kingsleyae]
MAQSVNGVVQDLASKRLYSRMEASSLELALEGERLCKAGNYKEGASFFEAAVRVGTEDLKTLSAIYSQLGNAYFYLKEYSKAMEYHKHDLMLARTIGDRIGEGKASSNLGNTLKVLQRFDEAVVCCQRHLDIAREQRDKVGEARALYNIGNVLHTKGKQKLWGCPQDPGDIPPDVRDTLQRATQFYEMNLSLISELGDRAAQGRAFGNLGNTHYLLGNFVEAIKFHRKRLSIAKEFGDKAAERRAYSNLGNAHIFLGQFNAAAEYYRKTLQLSHQLKDQVMEAQACYSLGNTYTLLQEYIRAIEFHLKHLVIAQQLSDRVGEGRACWSLGNAYVSQGKHQQALHYAQKHLEISTEIGDRNGELTARMNVEQLMLALGMSKVDLSRSGSLQFEAQEQGARPKFNKSSKKNIELWKCSSEKKLGRDPSDEDCFFDLLSKFQSSRMDDQRCNLNEQQVWEKGKTASSRGSLVDNVKESCSNVSSSQTEELFDLIASSQSRRLDDQRASVGNLPGLKITHNNLSHLCGETDAKEPGDDFFNMLVKCQSSRIDDQRCSPPDLGPKAPTVPDEDFFSLIQRVQAKRMDEQRVFLPTNEPDEASSDAATPPSGDSS